MPTLRMKNFRIYKVEEGKANAGSFYVKADVYDPKNGVKEFNPVNRFGKEFVNTIRSCFPATGTYLAEDGTQQPWNGLNQNLPANITREEIERAIPMTHKRIPNAMTVSVDLGGEYARKYGQARKDRNGVMHDADDLICEADGTFKVYTAQDVLTSMEYEMGPATDQNGNLIPNPKFDPNDPDCTEEEWMQTVLKDENGVLKMHEAEGWKSKPQAENIKQAFMLSVESAIAKCKTEGKPEMIPYRYRPQNGIHTGEQTGDPGPAGEASPSGGPAF